MFKALESDYLSSFMVSIRTRITIPVFSDNTRIWLFSPTELTMRVSGTPKQSKGTEEAIKSGAMAAFTKDTGRVTKQMDGVD